MICPMILVTKCSPYFYNLLFCACTVSRRTRRKILPLAFFGISSMKITPPCSLLGGDTLSESVQNYKRRVIVFYFTTEFLPATYLITSSLLKLAFGCRTTKANANSPASGSGTPITPTSFMTE